MASKDSDKPDRGRLVPESLEFSQSGSGASAFQNDVKAGQLLGGKYRVIEVLGRGKAGVMYKVSTAYTCPWSQAWPP